MHSLFSWPVVVTRFLICNPPQDYIYPGGNNRVLLKSEEKMVALLVFLQLLLLLLLWMITLLLLLSIWLLLHIIIIIIITITTTIIITICYIAIIITTITIARQVPCLLFLDFRHRQNGYLAQRVPSLFLASSFRMCLNCEFLKIIFPLRTRYPLS